MSTEPNTIRLDVAVVQQGLVTSRERAKTTIKAGQISDESGHVYQKPAESIDDQTVLKLTGDTLPYVSRGGLKLERALQVFSVSLANKIVVDVGASTGGFTDVALQNGAQLVYAIDVGTNQLVDQLKADERVISREQSNFRSAGSSWFTNGQPTVAVIDVSFIGLSYMLTPLAEILPSDGEVVALIKPQFEAGPQALNKHGVVADRNDQQYAITKVIQQANSLGFSIRDLTYSPITGGDGNHEYLAYFVLDRQKQSLSEATVSKVVADAYDKLRD